MTNFKLKSAIVVVLFALISNSLFSQDLIVTGESDSLYCKIIKIEADSIYFTFKNKDEIRDTLLAISQVKFYQYNCSKTSVVPTNRVVRNKIYPHFRAAINGGLGYRVAKLSNSIPSDFIQYMRNLKSGYYYGLDLSYYFSEQLGVGFKYYAYRSKNSMDIYVVNLDGSTQYGKMSDDILIDFIGPFFSTRFLNANKKNSLILNFGLGYMGYKDKAVLITDYTIKGSTLGLCGGIGYDIGISKNFAIGFQFSYMLGVLTKYELSDGVRTATVELEQDSYENLSWIDLSIGLRFNK